MARPKFSSIRGKLNKADTGGAEPVAKLSMPAFKSESKEFEKPVKQVGNLEGQAGTEQRKFKGLQRFLKRSI